MPKIPTNTDPVSFSSPALGPRATPQSFGDQRGAMALAQSVDQLGRTSTAIGQRLLRDKAQSWASESLAQLGKVYSDFMNNEENLKKESLDVDFESFAVAELEKYRGAAPNKEALNMFSPRAQMTLTSYMGKAAGQASKNRSIANYESVKQMVNNLTVEAHNNYESFANPSEASAVMDASIQNTEEAIDTMFEGLPESQKELKHFLYRSTALAAIEQDPKQAERLAKSTWLDEPTRQTILNRIEAIRGAVDSELRVVALAELSALEGNSRDNLTPVNNPPLVWYQAHFGKDAASAKRREWGLRFDAANHVVEALRPVLGLQMGELTDAVTKLRQRADKNPTNLALRTAYKDAAEKVRAIQTAYKANPLDYLQKHHPVLSRSWKDSIDEAASLEARAAARSKWFDQLEYYQSPAPRNEETGELVEPELHHPVPYDSITYVDSKTAESIVADLTSSDSNNFAEKANELASSVQAPGDIVKSNERVSNLTDDLVRLGGMHGAWEMGFMKRNAQGNEQYINSLINMEGNKKLVVGGNITETSVSDAVKADDVWEAFVFSSLQDGQGGNRIAEYKQGVEALAYGKLAAGRTTSVTDAVAESTEYLINSLMKAKETEGGKVVAVSRKRRDPTAPDRTDEDIDIILTGVDDLFHQFDRASGGLDASPAVSDLLRKINRKDENGRPYWPNIEMSGLQEDDKLQLLAKSIALNGFVVRTRDGNGATIYVNDDVSGFGFQLTDQNGNPIMLDFEKKVDPLGSYFYPQLTEQGVQLPGPSMMEQMATYHPQMREVQWDFPMQDISATDIISGLWKNMPDVIKKVPVPEEMNLTPVNGMGQPLHHLLPAKRRKPHEHFNPSIFPAPRGY